MQGGDSGGAFAKEVTGSAFTLDRYVQVSGPLGLLICGITAAKARDALVFEPVPAGSRRFELPAAGRKPKALPGVRALECRRRPLASRGILLDAKAIRSDLPATLVPPRSQGSASAADSVAAAASGLRSRRPRAKSGTAVSFAVGLALAGHLVLAFKPSGVAAVA